MMTLYNKQTINQHFLLHLVPSLYIYPSSEDIICQAGNESYSTGGEFTAFVNGCPPP